MAIRVLLLNIASKIPQKAVEPRSSQGGISSTLIQRISFGSMRFTRWMRARNNSSIKSLVFSEMRASASSKLGSGDWSRSLFGSEAISSFPKLESSTKTCSASTPPSAPPVSTSVGCSSKMAVSGSSSTSTGVSAASSLD